MSVKIYSLWITPPEKLHKFFTDLISRLSDEHNTEKFEPHITFMEYLELQEHLVLAKTADLVGLVKPFKVRLNNIDYLNEYFKCMFVKVQQEKGIMMANGTAKTLFGQRRTVKYMPHLSLIYGQVPVDTKKRIVVDLSDTCNAEFLVTKFDVVQVGKTIEPSCWRRIRSFELM